MAYTLGNISQFDLKPSTALGVKIPFSSNSVFKSVYSTKDQLKYNIINYLLTDPRERLFNPTFGSGLRSKIFQQITSITIEEIRLSLTTKLEKQFPNILVTNIEITPNYDSNLINISLSYTITNTGEIDEANIDILKA